MNAINRTPWAIYLTAAVISILLSFWMSVRSSVINPDAICYVQSAEALQSGLNFAMHLCGQAKWPFYSILIFGLVSVTKISYVAAAYSLNAFFSLISVVTFIAIVRSLGGTRRVLWLAAAVILLAHEFNAVRQYIIRDHGFWAFYLLSILFLLHYLRTQQSRFAFFWSVSLIIAGLFRVEGIVFLLLIPFLTWFDTRKTMLLRAKSFLLLNTLTLLALAGVCIWLLLHPSSQLGRLREIQQQFFHGVSFIVNNFYYKKTMLETHVLVSFSERDATTVFSLMLIVWYISRVAMNLPLIYFALVVYAWWKKLLPADRIIRLVLWSYIIINVIVTFAFLLEFMFLSKRYLVALSLVLMIWVPFALDRLIQQWYVRKWSLALAVLFITTSAIGGIFDFGYSKQYVRDAGEWLEKNTPAEASVYSNDYQVMYHSHHFGNGIFQKIKQFKNLNALADNKWKQYDYLALQIVKKQKEKSAPILREIQLTPVQVFSNKRGDQVIIYKVPK